MNEHKLNEYQKHLYGKYVIEHESVKLGKKTTVVILTLKNGFEIVGTSACVDEKDFNDLIGKHFALVDALTKLDGYVGFLRHEQKHVISKININENHDKAELFLKEVDRALKKLKDRGGI